MDVFAGDMAGEDIEDPAVVTEPSVKIGVTCGIGIGAGGVLSSDVLEVTEVLGDTAGDEGGGILVALGGVKKTPGLSDALVPGLPVAVVLRKSDRKSSSWGSCLMIMNPSCKSCCISWNLPK